MLWLQRWTADLRYCMIGAASMTPNIGQWLQKSLEHNDQSDREEKSIDLWKAVVAINEFLDDAETIEKILDAACVDEAGKCKTRNADPRTRIQTLDLGGTFADVDQQLRRMDVGKHDKDQEVCADENETISQKKGET